MSWTDERVETLKKMWAEGQSASQIAKELGGVTRNAVIGKVHRLGLSNRTGAAVKPSGKERAPEEDGLPETGPITDGHDDMDDMDIPIDTEVTADADADARDAEGARAAPHKSDPRPDARTEPADHDRAPSGAMGGVVTLRKQIIPAGQPLPPQPSANEISPEALASVREVEKKARRLTLMELTERTCKWPIGDPATSDFWFCGLPTQAGKPYCDAHVSVAFQPMSSRRDRRR